jgi:azurin
MMRAIRAAVFLLAAAATGLAATNKIEITCLASGMKYDREGFDTDPGNTVALTVTNADSVEHNLVICRPGRGVGMIVAYSVINMGAQAAEAAEFIPKDPNVLFHTSLLKPGQAQTLVFTAPELEGDYAYVSTVPGQIATMRGVMRNGGPRPEITKYDFAVYSGHWTNLPDLKGLAPVKRGFKVREPLTLSVAEQSRDFAIDFTGELAVPKDGAYTFYLDADDGARLWIDDAVIANYDGSHRFGADFIAKANLTRGYHAVRLEYYQAAGSAQLALAWSGPGFPRVELADDPKYPTDPALMRPILADEPLVYRGFAENGPTRAIFVGFKGLAYCFDAAACAPVFAWTGGFVDLGPSIGYDIRDRGGRPVKILGDKFSLGGDACPLRIRKSAQVPAVRFIGYVRHGTDVPILRYMVDGLEIFERISPLPAGDGIKESFEVQSTPWPVFYVVDPDKVNASSQQGEFKAGTLTLQGPSARSFEIVLRRK